MEKNPHVQAWLPRSRTTSPAPGIPCTPGMWLLAEGKIERCKQETREGKKIQKTFGGLIAAFPGQTGEAEFLHLCWLRGVPSPAASKPQVSPPVCFYYTRHQGSLLNFGPAETWDVGKVPSWLF